MQLDIEIIGKDDKPVDADLLFVINGLRAGKSYDMARCGKYSVRYNLTRDGDCDPKVLGGVSSDLEKEPIDLDHSQSPTEEKPSEMSLYEKAGRLAASFQHLPVLTDDMLKELLSSTATVLKYMEARGERFALIANQLRLELNVYNDWARSRQWKEDVINQISKPK